MVAHNLDYWNNPRGSIAAKFYKNDFAYATSGAMGALGVVSFLPVMANELKNYTMLDYGCGTGRSSRPLAMLFKGVCGYDPNKECIKEFAVENKKAEFNRGNLVFTDNFADVPEMDYGCCVNVIEHLTDADAQIVVDNLKLKVRRSVIMVYSVKHNWELISPFLSDPDYAEDLTARENGGNLVVRLINIRK
jgi:2-polyprenyl-3-methyl-5-hydroxy-6-metoxy-1,4-benzoquinol methylase